MKSVDAMRTALDALVGRRLQSGPNAVFVVILPRPHDELDTAELLLGELCTKDDVIEHLTTQSGQLLDTSQHAADLPEIQLRPQARQRQLKEFFALGTLQ